MTFFRLALAAMLMSALPAHGADRTIYLTFDDGPLNGTSNILDVLEAAQVPATLFMVGMHAEASASNRPAFLALYVFPQRRKHLRKFRQTLVGQSFAKPLVEDECRLPQRLEQRFSRLRQFDQVNPAVNGIAPPRQQALRFHRVEMMGQRRALDADHAGEFALIGKLARLDRQKREPDRQCAACFNQGSVEGLGDKLGGSAEIHADRRAVKWCHDLTVEQAVGM